MKRHVLDTEDFEQFRRVLVKTSGQEAA